MIIELAATLLSLVILLACFAFAPTRAECPPSFHVEALRHSGRYICRHNPLPEVAGRSARGGYADLSPDRDELELEGHTYCSSSRPIVVSDRVVGCSR